MKIALAVESSSEEEDRSLPPITQLQQQEDSSSQSAVVSRLNRNAGSTSPSPLALAAAAFCAPSSMLPSCTTSSSSSSTSLQQQQQQSPFVTASRQSMYQAAGFGNPTSSSAAASSLVVSVSAETRKLAQELQDFVARGLERSLMVGGGGGESISTTRPNVKQPASPDRIRELQLQTARRLRQLLPSNTDLLHLETDRNWIPLLLGWLNLHDRPDVQVEALLALTSIAELCSQQQQQQQQSQPKETSSPVVSPSPSSNTPNKSLSTDDAYAYAVEMMGKSALGGYSDFFALDQSSSNTSTTASASSSTTVTHSPGPPLFSTAPFEWSVDPPLSSTLTTTNDTTTTTGVSPFTFPNNTLTSSTTAAAATAASPNAFFSSGGAKIPISNATLTAAAAASSMFLPSATSSTTATTTSSLSAAPLLPQPLSPSSQHLLLRHADAIPTLISLLSSPSREVHEQAMWILGSIAAGDSMGPAPTSSTGAAGILGKDGILTNHNSMSKNDASSASSPPPPSLASSGSGDKLSGLPARDVVLAKGVMRPLLKCLETHCLNLSLQRIGAWVLSNLVEGQFQQPPSSSSSNNNGGDNGKSSSSSSSNNNNNTKGSGENSHNTSANNASDEIVDMNVLLPTLRRLLSMADAEVLSYTCWTLSHLCDGPSSHIAAVVTTPPSSTTMDPNQPFSLSSSPPGGLVPRLVELLLHPSWRVTKPALRTIGNIVCAECGDEQGGTTTNHTASSGSIGSSSSCMITDYTEVILDCGAVPRLTRLITHSNREIQKEACWTLSNIAAGTVNQIEAVIRSNAIPPLVELVKDKNTDHEVRSEACWVVLNATSCGSDQQIETLVDEGCVSVLGVLLGEASMVMMALEGLERVLQVEETREVVRKTKIAAARVLERGIDLDDPEFARSIMVRNDFEQQQNKQGSERPPPLVSPSLIEKALEKHNNSAVTKRAGRIWKQHFVSCALCRQSFSRHRAGDAHFCEECKCHVCKQCDCKVYHLSYQEELWAESEEKKEATKRAKKSKKQKKKEKQKEKKAKQQQQQPPLPPPTTTAPKQLPTTNTSQTTSSKKATNNNTRSRSSTVTSSVESVNRVPSPSLDDLSAVSSGSDPKDAKVPTSTEESKSSHQDARKKKGKPLQSGGHKEEERVDDENHHDASTNTKEIHSEGEDQQPPIDFVLYLQQTGSIIALAKLMDALEYGNDGNEYDEEIDAELQMLSPTNGGHNDMARHIAEADGLTIN